MLTDNGGDVEVSHRCPCPMSWRLCQGFVKDSVEGFVKSDSVMWENENTSLG